MNPPVSVGPGTEPAGLPSGTVSSRTSGSRPATDPLRPADKVMRLSRMGASFPTRLSFSRRLLRQLAASGASVDRPVWTMDANGHGRAVYRTTVGAQSYSLCAFTRELAPEERTDRVIATAWDAAFVLFDGDPDEAELERLASAAPLQEAGRFTARDLVLSRANKSTRLFEHVVERLAAGLQPDAALVQRIGYLMRTTAVYGNGKFGIADRSRLVDDPLLGAPFQAEMLTVLLIRQLTVDLAEHVARARGGERAVPLARDLRRQLGVGNATGLGMAPFLVSHPRLVHRWVMARETALARVRAVRAPGDDCKASAMRLLARARQHASEWCVDDDGAMACITTVRTELAGIAEVVDATWLAAPWPWRRLHTLAEACSADTEEIIVALLIELHPELVDELAETMACREVSTLDAAMPSGKVRALAEATYGWTDHIDFDSREATARFWYVSEDKFEPRFGFRFDEPGADRETPLGIARDARRLLDALRDTDPHAPIAALLMTQPSLRDVVRRVQCAASEPYAEIRDNLLDATCRPIDMLRFKLAFFGATGFDPRSDLWTRITLFQGAPGTDELALGNAPDLPFPVFAHTHMPPVGVAPDGATPTHTSGEGSCASH